MKGNSMKDMFKINKSTTHEHLSKRVLRSQTKSPNLEITNYENIETLNLSDKTNRHCHECDQTCTTRRSYINHLKEVHYSNTATDKDIQKLFCNFCLRRFKCFESYSKHMEIQHTVSITRPELSQPSEEVIKQCIICSLDFTCYLSYYQHLKNQHGVLDPENLDIGKLMSTIEGPGTDCILCNTTYASKLRYLNHLLRIHRITLPKITSVSKTDIENLYCPVCEKTFKIKFRYIRHLNIFHHTTLPIYSNVLPDVNDPDNFCLPCDRAFFNSKVLLEHIVRYHLKDLPELYKGNDLDVPSRSDIRHNRYCADCKKVFLYKDLYRIHLAKIHHTTLTGNLPNMDEQETYCRSCDREYTNQLKYRRHLIDIHCMGISPLSKKNSIRKR